MVNGYRVVRMYLKAFSGYGYGLRQERVSDRVMTSVYPENILAASRHWRSPIGACGQTLVLASECCDIKMVVTVVNGKRSVLVLIIFSTKF